MTAGNIYAEINKLAPYTRGKGKDFKYVLKDALELYMNVIANIEGVDKERLQAKCAMINEVVRYSYRGLPSAAFSLLARLLNEYDLEKIFKYKVFEPFVDENDTKMKDSFYRMRVFEKRRNIDRQEMFHIPLNARRMIRTQRYSTPGFPCLYMGLSTYGCWEEMGRPRMSDCWASRLENTRRLNLLDLRVPSFEDFIIENDRPHTDKIYMLFPIIIACMIPVEDYDGPYKPEYIIPQLITEWIISKRSIDGIIYTSAIAGDDFEFPTCKLDNIVIPVKRASSRTKYCPNLVNMFRITKPANNEIEKLKCGYDVDAGDYNRLTNDEGKKMEDNMSHKSLTEVEINKKEWDDINECRKKNYETSDFEYFERRLKDTELFPPESLAHRIKD